MAPKAKRTRLWIDPAVQRRLLVRAGVYLLVFPVVVMHVGFLFEFILQVLQSGVHKSFEDSYVDFLREHRYPLLAWVMLLPTLLYDLLKFSHRIAGPLFRCRRVMEEMASGKPVPEFVPRKHDLMRELFQAFNALIKEWNSRLNAHANGQSNGAQRQEGSAHAVAHSHQ